MNKNEILFYQLNLKIFFIWDSYFHKYEKLYLKILKMEEKNGLKQPLLQYLTKFLTF